MLKKKIWSAVASFRFWKPRATQNQGKKVSGCWCCSCAFINNQFLQQFLALLQLQQIDAGCIFSNWNFLKIYWTNNNRGVSEIVERSNETIVLMKAHVSSQKKTQRSTWKTTWKTAKNKLIKENELNKL